MQVAKILRSHRIPPAPRRSQSTWREFVRQHAAQMLATDFFTVETAWLQRLHVLFFVEIASRKVHLGGITASQTGLWVAQQARNLAWKLQEGTLQAKFLLRDRDCKFTASFDHVFRSEGVEVLRLGPRANSIAERFVGTWRRDVLDHMLSFSAGHLVAVIREFLIHYYQARPHQGSNSAARIPSWPSSRCLCVARSSATIALEVYSTSTPEPRDRVECGPTSRCSSGWKSRRCDCPVSAVVIPDARRR